MLKTLNELTEAGLSRNCRLAFHFTSTLLCKVLNLIRIGDLADRLDAIVRDGRQNKLSAKSDQLQLATRPERRASKDFDDLAR